MKFSCVILICPFVIALTMAMMQFTHTTFDSCNPDEWTLTNTTLNWINDTKIITSNIIYKEANNSKIYEVHIVMNECTNQTICTGKPTISIVKNINCEAENLSESDMNVCKIADELANLGKDEEYFENRYGWKPEQVVEFVICVKIDADDLIWNDLQNLNNF